MSRSLRERWQRQLDAAQVDPSWKAQIEIRLLRFLLARYDGQLEDAPLSPCPFYQGNPVPGRARLLLSRWEQHRRLEHIAQVDRERLPDELSDFEKSIEYHTWRAMRRRQYQEALRYTAAPESLTSPDWLPRDASEYVMTVLARKRRW